MGCDKLLILLFHVGVITYPCHNPNAGGKRGPPGSCSVLLIVGLLKIM